MVATVTLTPDRVKFCPGEVLNFTCHVTEGDIMQWSIDFVADTKSTDITESLLATDGVGTTVVAYSMPLMMGTVITVTITSGTPNFMSVMTTSAASNELHQATVSCTSPNQMTASVVIHIAGKSIFMHTDDTTIRSL